MIVIAVRVSPALELLLVIQFYVLCRLVSSYCLKYFPIALDAGNSPGRCKTSFVIMAVDIRYLSDGCKLEDSAKGISARINSQGYWCSFRIGQYFYRLCKVRWCLVLMRCCCQKGRQRQCTSGTRAGFTQFLCRMRL